jgi:hypothetical protein
MKVIKYIILCSGSGSRTAINYGSVSDSDFLTSYGSGSGSGSKSYGSYNSGSGSTTLVTIIVADLGSGVFLTSISGPGMRDGNRNWIPIRDPG